MAAATILKKKPQKSRYHSRTVEMYTTFPVGISVSCNWQAVGLHSTAAERRLLRDAAFAPRRGRVGRWLTRKSQNRLNCIVVQSNFRYTQFTVKGQVGRSISPKASGFRPQFLWQKCKSNGQESKYAVCSGGEGSSDLETKGALIELKHIMAISNLV